ncbi:ABC transporter substrate-binding protein [Pendulispora albinea]|uniref:ABC transporter substrate-binding protein n=1 Tax=Pendulispora albinea TaxID=2741071 RepID=A0ABZ2M3P6_9BACT
MPRLRLSRAPLLFALAVALVLASFSERVRAQNERSARNERSGRTKLRVLVPDGDNLQYMAFWLAKGAGYFEEEGLDVTLVIPPSPRGTRTYFDEHRADAAVLPPPMYLEMIASRMPVVLVANLLKNDPIELVVRRSILEERRLSDALPLRDRLAGLRGLRLGIAPHPPTRLRALFASQGLDPEDVLSIVTLHGNEQNEAFRAGKVDALYAHTPYVEQAIVRDDAVVLVNQSAGEVPVLKDRQIHAFAVERSFLASHRDAVIAAVRAIGRAERLLHGAPREAVDVLARTFPSRDRRELTTIVALYVPAIPEAPEVKVERIPLALTFFPAGMKAPELSGIDIGEYVDTTIAERARLRNPYRGWMIFGGVSIALLGMVAILRVRARRRLPGAGWTG